MFFIVLILLLGTAFLYLCRANCSLDAMKMCITMLMLKRWYNIDMFYGIVRQMMQPLKWELKQRPGISPPRGGFKPDDPNQQIVAEEDIFDEYGGMY